VVHAADESGPAPSGTFAFALAVPDEPALVALADRLEAAGVQLARIHEPDPPWNGQLTALGIRPQRKEALRRHLSSIPKLK
jgi:hypothetical protein